jgi:predicted DNA-binding transcriptional regulator AlpA
VSKAILLMFARYLSDKRLAELLGRDGEPLSRTTIYRMRKRGELPPRTKLDGKTHGTAGNLVAAMLAARTENPATS